MILFVTTAKHRYTHAKLRAESGLNAHVMSYEEMDERRSNLPAATYIFTDIDRLTVGAAARAGRYFRALRDHGQAVLNDPAQMHSRFGLLRALNRAGINDFDAYRVEDLEQPRRWPVFLRLEGIHGDPVSGLLNNRRELERAIEAAIAKGYPRAMLLIIEYAAEPIAKGLYRKLSAFRIGDRMLGYTCVHDDQWIVKYGKAAIATPAHYEEEYRFVATNPFEDALWRVFELARIDYGRVDFGLVGGRPQIYEINSNPHVQLNPEPSPVARRNESVALFKSSYVAALRAIDSPTPAAAAAPKSASAAVQG